MSGPRDFDDAWDLAVAEQPPIWVYTNEADAIVIKQYQCEEGNVFIFVRPHNAMALCRKVLEAAEIDPDVVLRDVPKDVSARERQRRHRERLRDSHGQDNVTVTAKLANDVDEPHQEMGSLTTS
jgi:hypothetical protein